jgi:hypothetical protein
MPPKAPSTRAKRNVIKRSSAQNRVNGRKRVLQTVSESEDADDTASDAYQDNDDEDDIRSLHSDALDDDSDLETKKRGKRKRASPVKPPRAKGSSPRKRHKNAASDEDEEGEDYDLKEGQQVVGRVVQAPKTGRGQLLQLLYITTTDLIYLCSPPRPDISKYPRFSFAAHRTRVQ